jgi:predicted MFS family arabinose efflux permease
MDSAGAIIGPVLSVTLVATCGFRAMFLLTLIPGALAALAVLLFVRERPHKPQPTAQLWGSVRALPRNFKQYLVGIGIAGIGDFSNTLLILWATQAWTPRFGLTRAANLAMLFYVGYNAVYTVSCYASGFLADRFPKHWVLSIGYSFAVIPATALIVPGDSLTKFGIVFGVSGLYMGVWETLESTTAATILPPEVRGTGFGILAAVNGLGDFVSSFAVGLLWALAPSVSMSLVIATSLIGAAIIAFTGERLQRRTVPDGR